MAKDSAEIGCFWIKSSARGEYLSGTIHGQQVVAFRNDNKKNDRQPDWRVLVSKPKGERVNTQTGEIYEAAKQAVEAAGGTFEDDDSIPF